MSLGQKTGEMVPISEILNRIESQSNEIMSLKSLNTDLSEQNEKLLQLAKNEKLLQEQNEKLKQQLKQSENEKQSELKQLQEQLESKESELQQLRARNESLNQSLSSLGDLDFTDLAGKLSDTSHKCEKYLTVLELTTQKIKSAKGGWIIFAGVAFAILAACELSMWYSWFHADDAAKIATKNDVQTIITEIIGQTICDNEGYSVLPGSRSYNLKPNSDDN